METFGRITPNVPLRFKNKQEHIEDLDCEVPGCDRPSQSDYTFDRGGKEWMIGTCKHHDHVEHALQALNQHINQMTPVVNAAAETKDKKYMYNSYEPEDYDYLDEASKREYVDKYGEVSDYDYEGTTDPQEVIKNAEAEHGSKFANQLRGVGKPRTKDSGIDPLGRLAGNKPTRITTTGKANKQDVGALKDRIKARLGVRTVTTNRHGGDWAKRTYVKEEHLEEASIPKHLVGRYKKMVKRYADSIHAKHPDYSDDKKFRIASATAMKVLGVTEAKQQYKNCPTCEGTGEQMEMLDCGQCSGSGERKGKACPNCSGEGVVPKTCMNCGGEGILSPMQEAYQRPPRKITPKLTGRVAKKGYDEPDSEKVTNIVQGIRQFNVQNFLKDLPRNTPESVKRQHALAANPQGYPKVRMGKQVTILVGSHGDQSEAGKRAGDLSNFLMQQGHETQPFVTQGQNGYNYGVRPVVSKPGARSMKEQLFSDEELDRLQEKLEHLDEEKGITHLVRVKWTHRKYQKEPMTTGFRVAASSPEDAREKTARYLKKYERVVHSMKVSPYSGQASAFNPILEDLEHLDEGNSGYSYNTREAHKLQYALDLAQGKKAKLHPSLTKYKHDAESVADAVKQVQDVFNSGEEWEKNAIKYRIADHKRRARQHARGLKEKGSIPRNRRERELAAMSGDPETITKGDVLKARGVVEDFSQMQEAANDEVRGLTRSTNISARNYSRMQKNIGRGPNSKGMAGSRHTEADYLAYKGKELPHILHANGKDVHWKFRPEGRGDMDIHVTTEHEFGEPESATRSRVTNALGGYARSGYKIPANEVEKGVKALRRMISEEHEADDLQEAKATYCGRCGTTHVKPSMGGKCPAMNESVEVLDAYVDAITNNTKFTDL